MQTSAFKLDVLTYCRDFPGGPVLENSLCSAGEVGLIPGRGTKRSHAVEQPVLVMQLLSLCTLEPVCHR